MTELAKQHNILDKLVLNNVQKDAVAYTHGPQLVFAGAGTGKTRVLTAKIAYLIKQCGYRPESIFAATFTNKAANEMKSRIESYIDAPCHGLWIATFHSLCARILRRHASALAYTSSFSIYDTADQQTLAKKILRSHNVDERSIQPKQLLNAVSRYKNKCLGYEDIDRTNLMYREKELVRLYELYQKALVQANAMDFDDLITNTVFLFKRYPDILKRYQNMFQYILVDEYQDTDIAQFTVIKMLAQSHKRLFVVGDDDQSIYGWRGANIENILKFDQHFPETKTFVLEQNYRSTQSILTFANSIIQSNKYRSPKSLWSSRNTTHQVRLTRYRNDRHEAEGVVRKISHLIGNGVTPGDIALLFRTNAQSRVFEDALRKMNIPYIIVGGTSFYERKEIKDCLAYLRLIVNPKDSVSVERILNVPARGIGAKSFQKIVQIAQSNGHSVLETILAHEYEALSGLAVKGLQEVATLFSHLIEMNVNHYSPQDILSEMLCGSGYIEMLENDDTEESRSRIENINELLNAVTQWSSENPGKSLADFLGEIALVSDIDRWDKQQSFVNLMTFHTAKGLEFKTVFLVGLEDGIIPVRQNFDDDRMLEEECRLLYVGVTRAAEVLECSYADTRMRFGSIMPMEPSRFLEYVSQETYNFINQSTVYHESARIIASSVSKRSTKKSSPPKAKSVNPHFDDFSQDTVQFRMGQVVSHKKYGKGKVLGISGFGPDMQLTILFDTVGRKQILAKFAHLQTVS